MFLKTFFKRKTPAGTEQPQQPEMSQEEARAFISQIPLQAEKHRELAKGVFGIELDYSADSILKLDKMIQEGWPKPPTMLDQVVLGFGSYLGEAIRHIHGGDWGFNPEQGLYFDVGGRDIKIFPFAKVKKRFLNGDEDSLAYYYSFIRSKVEEAQKSA